MTQASLLLLPLIVSNLQPAPFITVEHDATPVPCIPKQCLLSQWTLHKPASDQRRRRALTEPNLDDANVRIDSMESNVTVRQMVNITSGMSTIDILEQRLKVKIESTQSNVHMDPRKAYLNISAQQPVITANSEDQFITTIRAPSTDINVGTDRSAQQTTITHVTAGPVSYIVTSPFATISATAPQGSRGTIATLVSPLADRRTAKVTSVIDPGSNTRFLNLEIHSPNADGLHELFAGSRVQMNYNGITIDIDANDNSATVYTGDYRVRLGVVTSDFSVELQPEQMVISSGGKISAVIRRNDPKDIVVNALNSLMQIKPENAQIIFGSDLSQPGDDTLATQIDAWVDTAKIDVSPQSESIISELTGVKSTLLTPNSKVGLTSKKVRIDLIAGKPVILLENMDVSLEIRRDTSNGGIVIDSNQTPSPSQTTPSVLTLPPLTLPPLTLPPVVTDGPPTVTLPPFTVPIPTTTPIVTAAPPETTTGETDVNANSSDATSQSTSPPGVSSTSLSTLESSSSQPPLSSPSGESSTSPASTTSSPSTSPGETTLIITSPGETSSGQAITATTTGEESSEKTGTVTTVTNVATEVPTQVPTEVTAEVSAVTSPDGVSNGTLTTTTSDNAVSTPSEIPNGTLITTIGSDTSTSTVTNPESNGTLSTTIEGVTTTVSNSVETSNGTLSTTIEGVTTTVSNSVETSNETLSTTGDVTTITGSSTPSNTTLQSGETTAQSVETTKSTEETSSVTTSSSDSSDTTLETTLSIPVDSTVSSISDVFTVTVPVDGENDSESANLMASTLPVPSTLDVVLSSGSTPSVDVSMLNLTLPPGFPFADVAAVHDDVPSVFVGASVTDDFIISQFSVSPQAEGTDERRDVSESATAFPSGNVTFEQLFDALGEVANLTRDEATTTLRNFGFITNDAQQIVMVIENIRRISRFVGNILDDKAMSDLIGGFAAQANRTTAQLIAELILALGGVDVTEADFKTLSPDEKRELRLIVNQTLTNMLQDNASIQMTIDRMREFAQRRVSVPLPDDTTAEYDQLLDLFKEYVLLQAINESAVWVARELIYGADRIRSGQFGTANDRLSYILKILSNNSAIDTDASQFADSTIVVEVRIREHVRAFLQQYVLEQLSKTDVQKLQPWTKDLLGLILFGQGNVTIDLQELLLFTMQYNQSDVTAGLRRLLVLLQERGNSSSWQDLNNWANNFQVISAGNEDVLASIDADRYRPPPLQQGGTLFPPPTQPDDAPVRNEKSLNSQFAAAPGEKYALYATVRVRKDLNHQNATFLGQLREGLVDAYREGRRRQLGMETQRARRSVDHDLVKAKLTSIDRSSPEEVLVRFFVQSNGDIVEASRAVDTFSELTKEELSAVLTYPVIQEVTATPQVERLQATDDSNTSQPNWVFVLVAVILAIVFVVIVCVLVILYLMKNKNHQKFTRTLRSPSTQNVMFPQGPVVNEERPTTTESQGQAFYDRHTTDPRQGLPPVVQINSENIQPFKDADFKEVLYQSQSPRLPANGRLATQPVYPAESGQETAWDSDVPKYSHPDQNRRLTSGGLNSATAAAARERRRAARNILDDAFPFADTSPIAHIMQKYS